MISHKELLENLRYESETGFFYWIKGGPSRSLHKPAGHIRDDGYYIIGINYRHYLGHVLAWFYIKGVWPITDIDHKDKNPRNNVFTNLRELSHSKNISNV